METKKKLISDAGVRTDGRRWNELRPIRMEVGQLKNADGSAYIEFGKNKIVAAVYGPKPGSSRSPAAVFGSRGAAFFAAAWRLRARL